MVKRPDIMGMKMSAAMSILDAADISYNIRMIKPPVYTSNNRSARKTENFFDAEAEYLEVERVVRVKEEDDGTLHLEICRICEPQLEEEKE